MKKLSYFFLLIFAISITSCKKSEDNDPTPPNNSNENSLLLVAIRNSDGQMFSIDPSNGETTDRLRVRLDGVPFSGARGLAYDANTEKGFIATTNRGGADLYSLDFSNGQLTLMNDNESNDEFDSIDGMGGIADNGNTVITAPYMYLGNDENFALVSYDKTTGDVSNAVFIPNSLGFGGGLTFGGQTASIYRGSIGLIEQIKLDDGTILESIDLSVRSTNPFTAVHPEFDIVAATVMNLAENEDGDIYGILLTEDIEENSYQFLVSINLNTGMVTYISTLQNGSSRNNRVFALAFVPASVFN